MRTAIKQNIPLVRTPEEYKVIFGRSTSENIYTVVIQ